MFPGFLSHLRRAVGRGVLQGYRTEEDTLQTVRGRVRFADQIRRHYGRCVPAEVTFDDFTAGIDENRILKAALRRLRGLRIRSPGNRQGLRRYSAALSFVADVEYPAQGGPSITYTRLNEHYRPAVGLAQLILRSTSFEFLPGHVTATGNIQFERHHNPSGDVIASTTSPALVRGKDGVFRVDPGWGAIS